MARKGISDSAPFEKRMARLKEIVEQLEADDIPLEKSVALYKEGHELVSRCREQLEQALTEVRMLSDDGTQAPFAPEKEEAQPD